MTTELPAHRADVSPAQLASRLRDKQAAVIDADGQTLRRRLSRTWAARRLIPYFGFRFLHKRYARTWLGRSWLFLRPALDLGTGLLVFGGILGISGDGAPYILVFIVASAAWQFFAQSAFWATRSLELSRRELRYVPVPRTIPVLSAVVPSFVEYLIYLAVTIGIAVYYVVADGTFYLSIDAGTLLVLPGLLLLALLGVGIGLWTAPLALKARDVRFGIGYLLSFWYFVTPVIYPITAIPEPYRIAASFNPVTAPLQMVKRGLLGYGEIPTVGTAITVGVLVVLLVGGWHMLGKHERREIESL